MSVKFLTDKDEKKFIKTVNGVAPDEKGNVSVQGGGGGAGGSGADGFSPIANVTQTDIGAVISITDKSGTTTATIVNGKDGPQGDQGPKGDTGTPGSDGANGKDGVSATHSWNGTTLTITSASGTSSANLKGDKGDTGAAGVSVSSVKQTTTSSADGGSNVVTVTLSNGTTSTFTVKNGSKGSAGAAGTNGKDGKTPVRGTDYWTEADQEDIVQQVIAALGTPVFGRVDADNNIILTGELADGTYTLKYEDADGNVTEIGTLEQGATYTNLADPSSPDWLTNKRLNSSGDITDATPSLTTNYIPVKLGDFVRIRFVNIFHQGSGTSNATTHFYDANKNRVASITPANANVNHIITDADGLGCSFDMTKASEKFTMVSGHSASEIQFARFVGKLYDGYTKEDVIITVNQEITD